MLFYGMSSESAMTRHVGGVAKLPRGGRQNR
ncbi:GMP reductase [Klebsiella pneumoniae]|uniref:GMP reductase n=1 Tax=Klebsiella pneumoniae TaxID=573 RepID=A0A3S4GIX3_KLEPN|nr:GMP reductase [Klebsiella pneumoniae]